jgi:hypothetical protein
MKFARQTLPLLHRAELGPLERDGQLIGADPDENRS